MSVKLPVAGTAAETQSLSPGMVETLAERREGPVPLIAVVSARARTASEVAFAAPLVAALRAAGWPVAGLIARTGTGEGYELIEDGPPESDLGKLREAGAEPVVMVRLHPQVATEALAAALDRACATAARVVVTIGAAVPAIYRTRLCVMLTGGLSIALWDLSARALRDRIDLELAEPRPGVARGLGARMARV